MVKVRDLEFGLVVPNEGDAFPFEVASHAAYDVCEDHRGVCSLLRSDLTVASTVDPEAPGLR